MGRLRDRRADRLVAGVPGASLSHGHRDRRDPGRQPRPDGQPSFSQPHRGTGSHVGPLSTVRESGAPRGRRGLQAALVGYARAAR